MKTVTWCWSKTTKKPSLQSFSIESRDLLRSDGKIWIWRAASDSFGKEIKAVWEARMVLPLGRPTGSPCFMGTLWVHCVVGTIKLLVHPESTMDLLSLVGLLLGTKIGEYRFFISEVLDVVDLFPDQVPLLVSDPCIMLALVAGFLWPGAGVVHFQLGLLYLNVQQ